MPGTLVTDSNAVNLLTGATLNAAGTTNSTAVEVAKPGRVRAHLKLSTVSSTGNSATLMVEIEGCDTSDFSTDQVHSLAATRVIAGTDALLSNLDWYMDLRADYEFVRVVVTIGGTAPVFTGAKLTFEQPNYLRTVPLGLGTGGDNDVTTL